MTYQQKEKYRNTKQFCSKVFFLFSFHTHYHHHQLHANILPQLVYYWRMAGNHMKCFQYMIDAAASFIDVNDSMKTSSFLRDIDHMVEREREINNTTNNNNNNINSLVNFVITEEEKAKIECLKGQV